MYDNNNNNNNNNNNRPNYRDHREGALKKQQWLFI